MRICRGLYAVVFWQVGFVLARHSTNDEAAANFAVSFALPPKAILPSYTLMC